MCRLLWTVMEKIYVPAASSACPNTGLAHFACTWDRWRKKTGCRYYSHVGQKMVCHDNNYSIIIIIALFEVTKDNGGEKAMERVSMGNYLQKDDRR